MNRVGVRYELPVLCASTSVEFVRDVALLPPVFAIRQQQDGRKCDSCVKSRLGEPSIVVPQRPLAEVGDQPRE